MKSKTLNHYYCTKCKTGGITHKDLLKCVSCKTPNNWYKNGILIKKLKTF